MSPGYKHPSAAARVPPAAPWHSGVAFRPVELVPVGGAIRAHPTSGTLRAASSRSVAPSEPPRQVAPSAHPGWLRPQSFSRPVARSELVPAGGARGPDPTSAASPPSLLQRQTVPELDPVAEGGGADGRLQREPHVVLAGGGVRQPLGQCDQVGGGPARLGEVGPDVGERPAELPVDGVVREGISREQETDVVKVTRAWKHTANRGVQQMMGRFKTSAFILVHRTEYIMGGDWGCKLDGAGR